jgi:hypothetical protein
MQPQANQVGKWVALCLVVQVAIISFIYFDKQKQPEVQPVPQITVELPSDYMPQPAPVLPTKTEEKQEQPKDVNLVKYTPEPQPAPKPEPKVKAAPTPLSVSVATTTQTATQEPGYAAQTGDVPAPIEVEPGKLIRLTPNISEDEKPWWVPAFPYDLDSTNYEQLPDGRLFLASPVDVDKVVMRLAAFPTDGSWPPRDTLITINIKSPDNGDDPDDGEDPDDGDDGDDDEDDPPVVSPGVEKAVKAISELSRKSQSDLQDPEVADRLAIAFAAIVPEVEKASSMSDAGEIVEAAFEAVMLTRKIGPNLKNWRDLFRIPFESEMEKQVAAGNVKTVVDFAKCVEAVAQNITGSGASVPTKLKDPAVMTVITPASTAAPYVDASGQQWMMDCSSGTCRLVPTNRAVGSPQTYQPLLFRGIFRRR